ncbi:MAG: lysylphosphatidylglycerol synthase transmembrane domain-containing protein [Acholeplasmataceae bacterium]
MKTNKENYKNILPKIIFVVVLLLLVMTISVSLSDFNLLIKKISEIKIGYFLTALLISLIALLLNAFSSQIVLRAINKEISFKQGFLIQSIEPFFNGITPFSSGAQPFQLYYYHKNNVDGEQATSVLVVNFILFQLVSVLLTTIGLIIFWDKISELALHLKIAILIGFSINTTILVGLFLLAYVRGVYRLFEIIFSFFERFKFSQKLAAKLKSKTFNFVNNFQKGVKFLFTKKRVFILSSTIKLLSLIFIYSTTILLSKSLGFNFTLNENIYLIVVSLIATTTMMFVPLPGASGGTEYAFNFLLSNLIIGSHLITLLMLLWRMTTYYFGILVGLIGYIFLKKEGNNNENRNIY